GEDPLHLERQVKVDHLLGETITSLSPDRGAASVSGVEDHRCLIQRLSPTHFDQIAASVIYLVPIGGDPVDDHRYAVAGDQTQDRSRVVFGGSRGRDRGGRAGGRG